jgi:ribosomal protein L7/L12
MPIPLQIALGVVLAVLIALVLFRRSRRAATPAPPRTPHAPPSADLADRLRALLAAGKKIQAIKELRDRTGLSLADAKSYIDDLPSGRPLPPTLPAPLAPTAEMSPATVARARELIAADKPIQAVKAIREDTGWSLKAAKDAMERIRAGRSA